MKIKSRKKSIICLVAVIACLTALFLSPNLIKAEDVGTSVIVVPFLPPPGPVGDTTPPTIYDVYIRNITFDSATITWSTDESSRGELRYGLTTSYEVGTVPVDQFSTRFSITLSGLFSGKTYHFQITALDQRGNVRDSVDYFFDTLQYIDTTPPANVRDFKAEVINNRAIKLTWQNPADADFRGVKIQKSTTTYPSSPSQGETVFNGLAAEYTDNAVTPNITYYYTAFAFDQSLNYASGALAQARIITTATLKIKAWPEKRMPRTSNWSTLAQVEVRERGSLTPLKTYEVRTDDQGYGYIDLADIELKSYDIALKGLSYLKKVISNFTISGGENFADFTFSESFNLLAGDCHRSKDNIVNSLDISTLIGLLNTSDENADLNRDIMTNSIDINILLANIMKRGEP